VSTPADRAYVNARENGDTDPGFIEIIARNSPRHRSFNHGLPDNRLGRRTGGQLYPVDLMSCQRKWVRGRSAARLQAKRFGIPWRLFGAHMAAA